MREHADFKQLFQDFLVRDVLLQDIGEFDFGGGSEGSTGHVGKEIAQVPLFGVRFGYQLLQHSDAESRWLYVLQLGKATRAL